MMQSVTIVMYHVVQPAGPGILARLKGRARDEFVGQVGYIKRHYTPLRLTDLADAVAGAIPLPPNAIVLTFDDGYAAHAAVAAPILAAAGVPATFFPVASALLDRAVLTVNKIQCILAVADPSSLVSKIEAAVENEKAGTIGEYRRRWFTPSRWDPADVVYVKRLLQHALPEGVREPLVSELFSTLVTKDERAIADDLYMTVDDARELVNRGMTIGAHADRHIRLPTLSRDGQAREIDGALRIYDAIGMPRTRFTYSFANGEFNDDSIELLRARGCMAAVSTQPRIAAIGVDAMLSLPRLDTNDLPVHADAAPNEWTRRACAPQNG